MMNIMVFLMLVRIKIVLVINFYEVRFNKLRSECLFICISRGGEREAIEIENFSVQETFILRSR